MTDPIYLLIFALSILIPLINKLTTQLFIYFVNTWLSKHIFYFIYLFFFFFNHISSDEYYGNRQQGIRRKSIGKEYQYLLRKKPVSVKILIWTILKFCRLVKIFSFICNKESCFADMP